MFKLTVTKETFSKYLIEIGYNYKIKQYEDFISRIQKNIQIDLKNSIQEDTGNLIAFEIFKSEVINLRILNNFKLIFSISKEYLKEMIESGQLDLYLIEKRNIESQEIIQKQTYFYKHSKDIKINGNEIWKIKNKYKISTPIQRCLLTDSFTIHQSDKETIHTQINGMISRNVFDSTFVYENLHRVESTLNILKFKEGYCTYNDLIEKLYQLIRDKKMFSNENMELSINFISNDKFKEIVSILRRFKSMFNLSLGRALKLFNAIKQNNSKIFYDTSNNKDIFEIFRNKLNDEDYEKFIELSREVYAYEKLPLDSFYFEFKFADKVEKITLKDIDNKLKS